MTTLGAFHGHPATVSEIKAPFGRGPRQRARKVQDRAETTTERLPLAPTITGRPHIVRHQTDATWNNCSSCNDLRLRIGNANRYFRRMAAAVFNDDAAISLLRSLHLEVLMNDRDIDFQQHGRALAMLTAANFCELGADDFYITEFGQRFVDGLDAD